MQEVKKNQAKIAQDRAMGKALKLVVRCMLETSIITASEANYLKGMIHEKKVGVDHYVPTENEVADALAELPPPEHAIYTALLYSGLRISEIDFIVQKYHSLKVQEMGKFLKISLIRSEGNKNSFFCYVPHSVWKALERERKNPRVVSRTKSYISRNKLLPMKYLRKYFYTSAIGAGCPGEVADFMQGRVQRTIGGVHYLGVQRLADEWYLKVVEGIMKK